MNCNEVKESIYKSVYSNKQFLDERTSKHLIDCQDCENYHKELLYAKLTTDKLSTLEAVLNSPQELTFDIMDAIDDQELGSQKLSVNTLFWVKRMLAAASILLMIMFSYEQTIVTDKLIKLEEQMSKPQGITFHSSHAKRLLNYYPSQGMDVIKAELASRNILLKDKHLASLLLRAKSISFTPDELSNRLKYKFIHLEISNQGINVINAIKK